MSEELAQPVNHAAARNRAIDGLNFALFSFMVLADTLAGYVRPWMVFVSAVAALGLLMRKARVRATFRKQKSNGIVAIVVIAALVTWAFIRANHDTRMVLGTCAMIFNSVLYAGFFFKGRTA